MIAVQGDREITAVFRLSSRPGESSLTYGCVGLEKLSRVPLLGEG